VKAPEALRRHHVLVQIRVRKDAARYVEARGGSLYLWVSESGLLHTATDPPADTSDWHREKRSGIELVFAPSLAGATEWRIELRRLPRRRLEAISNMTTGLSGGEFGGGTGVW